LRVGRGGRPHYKAADDEENVDSGRADLEGAAVSQSDGMENDDGESGEGAKILNAV
jgi:hypothetical protein